MFYRFTLTVPANTPESDPVRMTLPLTHGIIHRVEIGFPPGLAGLVHVAIYRFEHQLWPSNPGEWFAWDGYNIAFNEDYWLIEKPFELEVRGWSEDDTFDQPVIIRIGIRSAPRPMLGGWARRLFGGRVWEE